MTNSDLPMLVTSEWLESRLGDDDIRVFDCTVEFEATAGGVNVTSGRPGWEQGHIPGAGFFDLLQDLSEKDNPLPAMLPPAAQFAEVMGAAGVGPGTRVVLYDRTSAIWAARIWWMLRCYGFDDAALLDGGLHKWTAERRPVSQEPCDYPPTTFEPKPRPDLMVSKDQVRAAMENKDASLVNALPPDEFSGKIAPYPRPGHIPGSVNVPAVGLLDDAGAYRSRDELHSQLKSVGALDAPRVITYCGGGVAACSDAFALTLLGHENVAVYDGSMIEWASDPECPMETGES